MTIAAEPDRESFNLRSPSPTAREGHSTQYLRSPFIYNGLSQSTASLEFSWGSFDGSTNAPILYPSVQIAFQPTQVRFRLVVNGATNDFRWYLAGGAYSRFDFQTATGLTGWTTLTTLTNSGAVFNYEFQAAANEASRFFRTVQQP